MKSINNGENTNEKLLQYYSNSFPVSEEVGKIFENKFPLNPSSLLIESKNELENHITLFQKLIKEHASAAKRNSMGVLCGFPQFSGFPKLCCGLSSYNTLINGHLLGYEQLIAVRDRSDDHCYNLLPFLINGMKKCLLIDPTYEQFTTGKIIKSKGVIIKDGIEWEYKTNRKDGDDLYPENFATLHDLKFNSNKLDHIAKDGNIVQKYLEDCFLNPIYNKNLRE